MAMLAKILLFTLSLCVTLNHTAILMTEKSTVIGNNTVNINIDTHLNLVNIEFMISIPSPLTWTGFGFDSSSMLGTYAIMIDYSFPAQNLVVFETSLGDHTIGNIYTIPEIIVLSDKTDGITRTVHIQRAINGTYLFPTAPTIFTMISAIGQQYDVGGCDGPRRSNCQHLPISGRSIKLLALKTQTLSPTNEPSFEPTTVSPSINPTETPTFDPTFEPTFEPTFDPTFEPTMNPTQFPTKQPTHHTTLIPTKQPTFHPTVTPTDSPITIQTSSSPTKQPTISPTNVAITSLNPTELPSLSPTLNPTTIPTLHPTSKPIFNPTTVPIFTSDPFTWICDENAKCRQHSITCGVANGTYCNLECTSPLSCEYTIFNCPDEADCNILCAADNACDALGVIGGVNAKLNVECFGSQSCITSNIHGIDSHYVNVTCFGSQSCDDITLRCPSYTVKENCKITAIGNELVANKLKLYADNSWMDIDKTSYLSSHTKVEMFCDSDSSQCTLQQTNGSWNCKDIESLCFISDTKILTTDIDTDIICIENDCRILCNSDNSCSAHNIYGEKGSDTLIVECNGVNSCRDSNIFGLDLFYLKVLCRGSSSCKNANIYGNNTGLLIIDCLYIDGSCQDIDVYCPKDNGGCIISNDGRESHDVHRYLDLYAVRGFDDLDISKYTATLINDNNTTNMMHCGDNYESFCKLDSRLFCECDDEILDYWSIDVMAVTISGSILILMVGLIGFCMFCKKSKKCTSYESVEKKKAEIELEHTDLMQNDGSTYNAIIMEEDSDHDNDDIDKGKDAKHSLYEKV